MMDIFRWIKREWDTTQSCRRRDSEPVAPVSGYNFNLPRSRDEAYLRALRKFNEWRHKERSPSFRRLSRRLSKKSNKSYSEQSAAAAAAAPANFAAVHSVMMKEVNSPEEGNNDESHLYEELKTPRRPRPKNLLDSAKKLLQKSQSFPTNNATNCNNNNVQVENTVNVLKSCQKCPVINEHDENEVEEFENNHCFSAQQIDLESMRKQSSPPKTFFRDNSNPFPEVRSPVRVNRYYLTSFNQPKRLFNCTNESIDKIVRESLPKDRDIFPENHQTRKRDPGTPGSRKYDFNPSAIYENEEKPNGTPQAPMYQTVINKHGDLVEYAIPFNDQNDEEFGDADESRNGDPKFKQVTSNLNASTFPLIIDNDASEDRRANKSLCDVNIYAELRKDRKNIIVTDLDKSDECPKAKGSIADIIEELETLKNWSKRLSDQSDVSLFVSEQIKGNHLIICTTNDISQRTSTLKSTMPGPILLSSGNFRKTSVCLRKVEKKFCIQSEQGLLHDLCILNKVKHPNVALLMAVCLDVNNKILSLVLEPFVTNINSMIYDSDYKIIMEDCIEYILQVIKAVIYLQENGIIHSNICSHNVLVCENKKVVKLSSFELATEVDTIRIENDIIYTFYGDLASYQKSNLKASIAKEGWSTLISKNKVPSQYLPYMIEYRKLYSEHYYQPPELLSSVKHFVFPSRQADVYSIALLLWEMLNSCVPFAIFSYEEIENLFQLNDSNQLPLFDCDRCEIFESLLHNGLITLPNGRLDNVQSMKFLVDEAKVSLKSNRSIEKSSTKDSCNNNYVKNSPRREEMNLRNKKAWNECARTSTFKRDSKLVDTKSATECNSAPSKKVRNQSNTCKYNSRSLDDILKEDVKTEKRKEYGFHIEDFSLPSTPIARKNKLRRNAWLSNKTLYQKSFDESEEDAFERLNNKNDNASGGLKNKLINVNIKIIQNKIYKDGVTASPEKSQDNETSANVSSQIEYWNSIASPGDINLKKRNNIELSTSNPVGDAMRSPDSNIERTCPNEQSTPRPKEQINAVVQEQSQASTIVPQPAQRSSVRKLDKDRAKYYPNMPELLSETFLRRSKKPDDFERTLWKREKEKCERKSPRRSEDVYQENDGVERPLRTSVKDTVHKFESFAKKSSRNSSLPIRSDKLLTSGNASSNASCPVSNALTDIYKPQSATISGNYFGFTNADSTTPESNISITKLDVNLSNCARASSPKLQSPNIASTTSAERMEKKTSYLTIPPLNVGLDGSKEKFLSTTSIRKTKPTLFSINIRKLNRRASDIGCVRKLAKRENSLRHSICGTDLVRSVAKMNLKSKQTVNIDINPLQKPVKSVASLAESDIQHCKLTCWKCGSKVFRLDEIAFNEKAIRTKRFLRRFSTSPVPTSSADVSQRIFPASSVEEMKSIEDLYIDDDFGSGQDTLGANMRLLSPEQDDLFDILSIDFLSTDFSETIE